MGSYKVWREVFNKKLGAWEYDRNYGTCLTLREADEMLNLHARIEKSCGSSIILTDSGFEVWYAGETIVRFCAGIMYAS